jgi:hypothetical protein
MSIFLLAAAIAFVLGYLEPPRGLVRSSSLKFAVWLLIAVVLTGLLLEALVALESGSLAHPHYDRVRAIALAPETAQAMLGFLAGAICRKFPPWPTRAEPAAWPRDVQPDGWRLPTSLAVLGGLALLAVFAPGGSALVDRLTGLQAGVINIQLAATASDRQLAISVDRDIATLDTIEDMPRSLRFLQYDCAYAGLAERFDDPGERARWTGVELNLTKGIRFRRNSDFTKFVRLVISAKHQINTNKTRADLTTEIAILKAHARAVAEKLFRLIETAEPTEPDHYNSAYTDALDERGRQAAAVQAEVREATDALSETDQKIQLNDPDWCGKTDDNPGAAEMRSVVRDTRAFYGLVAGLESFAGNNEREILLYSLARSRPTLVKDINVNEGLAGSLYYGGRPIGEVVPFVQLALDSLRHEAEVVERARHTVTAADYKETDKTKDVDKVEKLTARYERGRVNLQRQLAYLWALESLRPQENVTPYENVPLATAEDYAREAYQRSQSAKALRVFCVDDDGTLYDEDTYALVLLAIQANNLRIGAALDKEAVRKAQWLLDDARARLPGHSDSCVSERAPAWERRIYSHLRLAESLRK